MNFKDLSVSKKLIGVFALVLAVTIALGLFAQNSLSKVDDIASDIAGNWLPSVKALGQYQYAVTRYRAVQINLLENLTDEQREKYRCAAAQSCGIGRYRLGKIQAHDHGGR